MDTPRFVRGENTYITTGGKLSRRLGTEALASPILNGYRIDKMWDYETLDNPPNVYIVASVFNVTSGFWEIWYQQQTNTPIPFQQAGTYRDMNLSVQPHVGTQSRGFLYIKSFPSNASAEKLGTVIFNGTGGTVVIQPWGLLGPTVPAALANSAIGTITTSGGISATDSSVDVNITAGTLPAAPFVIQIDFEQIEVGTASGTTGAVTLGTLTRAFNGTVAAAHAQNATVIYRGWAPSAHTFTVNQFWAYAYSWKTVTGQYSNRSPAQTNPDALPSQTGPFFNQLPQITVQGTADTTNVPLIGIFRTTDGGGTFYWIEDITNTGAGDITYTDDTLTSDAGNMDPIPDSQLDTATVAPSLTSNSPPPAVLAPAVTGVATPTLSSPTVSFQSRLWYAIGNVLFFSAEEELTMGIPEESWPSGVLGNFFRFQYPITNLAATPNNIYVFTIKATYIITGTSLATFAAQLILNNYGAPYGFPNAVDTFNNNVVFMSHDYRIVLISDSAQSSPIVLSDPLFTDLVDSINAGAIFQITYWADLDKELLFITGHNYNDPISSRQWVYDVKKSLKLSEESGIYQPLVQFWNLPWTYPSTAQLNGRISQQTTQRRMIFASWDGTSLGALARIDPTYTTATDYTFAGTVNFDIDMVYCLTRVPAGDHVNQRRLPGVTPVVYSFIIERTTFAGDDDPSFYWFHDDFWTDPISVDIAENPPRRDPSKSYVTMEFMVFNVAQRVAWELTKIDSSDRFELQNFVIKYAPDAGA